MLPLTVTRALQLALLFAAALLFIGTAIRARRGRDALNARSPQHRGRR